MYAHLHVYLVLYNIYITLNFNIEQLSKSILRVHKY